MGEQTRVWTDGYAPPEQCIGRAETRSDLYALAATLYHLATGKAPRPFPYAQLDVEAGMNDPSNPMSAPKDRWFWELLRINLAEKASDRYFSVEDFKADLEKRQITKDIRCEKCRAVVAARTPYCDRCATRTTAWTVACNDCGKMSTMGSRFCIYCGNRF